MAIAPKVAPEETLQSWAIDHKHSYVGFEIKHLAFTTVRGAFHEYDGRIELDSRDLAHSHFSGEIDVASIDTHVRMRDEDLRSPNFFDVARFPKIRYESTRIETVGGNRFRVYGNLTIRDVTQEIVMEGEYAGPPVRDPWGTLRTGFSARGTCNRKAFGLTWDVRVPGGAAVVGDEVLLLVDIELIQA